MGFTSVYAETLALAFANSSFIFSFCASHSIICFCSSNSASATNLATLILSSSSFSLDDFDPLEDLDSFDVFDPFDAFHAELLLLLNELFDLSSSSAFFNQHVIFLFFNCYLATPRPTLGHYWGDCLTHPMLITCVLHIGPKGHWESCNEVGSLGPAEHLVGLEPGTFRFWSQRLNPLGHSLPKKNRSSMAVYFLINLPLILHHLPRRIS